ncbi:MAG: ComEC/Rec2 family competence protein [Pseudoruegeria sp.]
MPHLSELLNSLAERRGQLFVWCPVFFSIGIGLYFSLYREPDFWVLTLGAVLCVLSVSLILLHSNGATPVFIALTLFLAGGLVASIQANVRSAPVLTFRYYGPIEGRIIKIDRSFSEAVRLTLDQVILSNMAPDKTPQRIRVSLHGDQGFIDPIPGLRVMMTGHLSAPSGPVEPGGFDFRRFAWFQKLGGVGYTRSPVLKRADSQSGPRLWVTALRQSILRGVTARISGDDGAFVAALLTGDRSEFSADALGKLRESNLAHLLAISGLHMGLLCGLMLASVRLGFALWPWFALRVPTKKMSAVCALLTSALYLALSGGNVSTQRAFIMVAVMLVAILLDRRALTLRAVAIAAMLVLIIRPQSLLEPGFQMSFAATTALVSVWSVLKHIRANWIPAPIRWLGALCLSSVIAGLATAPYSAAHFNQIAHYGVLANLLALPVMSFVVMPAAILSALLWPFGLSQLGLWIMAYGCHWILVVAGWVAGLDGAVQYVRIPAPASLPLITLGGLFLILWRGHARWSGIVLCLAGFYLWSQHMRPHILIAGSGRTVGILTSQGRVLNKPKGDGFVVENWLENDGDGASHLDASSRTGFQKVGSDYVWTGAELTLVTLAGRDVLSRLGQYCTEGTFVVMAADFPSQNDVSCVLFHPQTLRNTGVIALYREATGWRSVTAADRSGRRFWTDN